MTELHCYIIIYDLVAPARDYSSLFEAIRKFNSWGKLTNSSWAITSIDDAVKIRDYLSQFIDNNDKLIIIKSGLEAAWTKVFADDQWVKRNLVL